ncbi:MAG: Holliday junction resolvase RuvX [Opitutaceae bacterium]
MRCLGIDYGERRWGLAYGDELGIATPLPALVSRTATSRWEELGRVVAGRRATDIVLGHPLNMDGTEGFKARETDQFAARLRKRFRLPIHLVDERLTSYEAESTLPARCRRGMRAGGLIDSRAAAILVQDFLDQRFPPLP